MIKKIDNQTIEVNNKQIFFKNEKIRNLSVFDDLTIIIFDCGHPKINNWYNNVIAICNKTGLVKWEVEKCKEIDKQNPYMSVFDGQIFFIFQKSNDTRFAVNKKNGKIIKNIDLNKGNRPW